MLGPCKNTTSSLYCVISCLVLGWYVSNFHVVKFFFSLCLRCVNIYLFDMEYRYFILLTQSNLNKNRFLFYVQSVVVIVQYLELYYNCTSATANLDALTLFSCGILALTKIIWFRIYADNLICNYSSAMNDYVTIDTEEKRIIMRNHAFWGRIICIIALLISYIDSVIFIVGHAQLSSEETKINITILGHQAGYAIPSTCTLAHFHISTDLYLVIFILQYIYLVIMCISNHGRSLPIT